MKDWLPRDPLARLRARLLELGVVQEDLDAIEQAARLEIEDAVDFAQHSSYPNPTELVKHVFCS